MPPTLPYLVLQKKIGQTPLQALEEWKVAHPEYASMPMTYAGRLDPMASGKLLVLLGDECKKQDDYTSLDKEYEVELVLDLSTDTGDALGLSTYDKKMSDPSTSDVEASFASVLGSHEVPYPIFSSKTVGGQPLFMYALANTLSSISIPEHTETIYRISMLKRDSINRDALKARIEGIISAAPKNTEFSKELGADFRQDAIRAKWEKTFTSIPERTFVLLHLRVTCASGTYMRTLAHRIGSALGTTGFALSIDRTKIGTYRQMGVLGRWVKEF